MSFPHFDSVGGDLLIASKSLAFLGWAAPAALTARVAIEQGLLGMVARQGKRVPERHSVGDLVDLLYYRRKPLAPNLEKSVRVYSCLSAVAHGAHVGLRDAVDLIEQTDVIVNVWRNQ